VRIVHAIHSFPPESHGGTESYVRDLARAQQARGDEVVVIAGSDRADRREPLAREPCDGLDVRRLRAPERGLAQLVGIDAASRDAFEATLRDFSPQLVHVHHWHNLTSDLVATARRHGAAVIVTLHDFWATCPLFFRLPDHRELCPTARTLDECARCVARLVAADHDDLVARFERRRARIADELAQADAVVALSEEQRAWLTELLGPAGARVETVPLPAPAVPRIDRPGRAARDPARLAVASWGALDPGKGLRTVVAAAERLADPARVTIHHHGRVLDAAERDAVRAAARRARLELHGPYSIEQLAAAAAGYDVAVFASRYFETWGLVVDEALAFGLPVLVSDRGAPASRVGARGRSFPAGDEAALAKLLAECLDGALLGELAAGRAPRALAMDDHLAALDAVRARGRR